MKRANVWEAPLYRPSHGIPYSVKTGVKLPLPLVTSERAKKISYAGLPHVAQMPPPSKTLHNEGVTTFSYLYFSKNHATRATRL